MHMHYYYHHPPMQGIVLLLLLLMLLINNTNNTAEEIESIAPPTHQAVLNSTKTSLSQCVELTTKHAIENPSTSQLMPINRQDARVEVAGGRSGGEGRLRRKA